MQNVLTAALDSLAGTQPSTSVGHDLAWSALYVSRIVSGYLKLRKNDEILPSKILIRPVLEVVFTAASIVSDSGFLFRKHFRDWNENRKMFAKNENLKMEAEHELQEMIKAFQQDCPQHAIEQTELSAHSAAGKARVPQLYESAYRIYSQFTHGNFLAVMGDLDDVTEKRDTYTMAWCVLMILDLLQKNTDAQIPDLATHKQQLAVLKGCV